MSKKQIKVGDVVDLRLGMDVTSGLALDGHAKFFRAYKQEDGKEIAMRPVIKDSGTAGSIRQAVINGSLTEAKAKFKKAYSVKEYDLVIGGVTIGSVEERSE